MSLADYEQEIVDQLYNTLIYDDKNKGILLSGEDGTGKTTIAINLANQLMEGWTIFYIDGIDPTLSPYLTWHIGTTLYSKKGLSFGGEISFGISFLPIPVSFEFSTSSSFKTSNYFLTPSEEAIISNIKKQTNDNLKILFIADNFELWDMPSKQLLQKIMHPKLDFLSEYNVNVLIITQKKETIDIPINWYNIEIQDIPDESLLHILREKGFAEQICLNDIRVCSGNDLSLAIMAARYYSESKENANGFFEILDRRCNSMPYDKQNMRQILGPMSIIDSYFSKEEVAFFIDSKPKDKLETEYQAEEYLQYAEDQMFIKGEYKFLFTNEKIKNYFKSNLAKKERYYHRKFSEFLQERHPEDYYTRGKHLALSLQLSDPKTIVEAWQLLLLAYFRRSSKTGKTDDVYSILDEISQLIHRLPNSIITTQQHVLEDFSLGYQELIQYNYKEALLHFQAITPSRLVPACLAECQRLILLCHIQMADDIKVLIQSANELYNTIENSDFLEDEQYCRAALVLLDAYIDRSNDYKKVSELKGKFIRIIQDHLGIPEFEEFEACYNRKAALYYAAIIAYQQTEQSILFYKNHYNRIETYMSLCNHSGNAVVAGKYLEAKNAIEECFSLIDKKDGWYYPSQYKVKNNKILLDYLTDEKNALGNRGKTFIAAQNAITSFSKLLEEQRDEISHVVLFNYIGLSMFCQTNTCEKMLLDANNTLPDLDEFYQYYLQDLNFAYYFLKGDIEKAKNNLNNLKALDAPLLRHYRLILQKRQLTQEKLLTTPTFSTFDPFEYHNIIKMECSNIQDNSCIFFGRGFLLSDLQFLSF